jgi:hypothetical protein
MFKRNLSFCRRYGPIICFKIKNPPTVHSTSRIQPTTSTTFVFSVSASVRKKWGYERKLLDSRFGRSSSWFYFHFIISLKKLKLFLLLYSSSPITGFLLEGYIGTTCIYGSIFVKFGR